MSLSLVSNSYIEETSAKIRSKPVPWEAYQRAGLVTPDELALIKRVDRQPRSKTDALLSTEGQTYALLYLGLLNKLNRVDTMQWILVLITDALTDHEDRISLFTRAVEKDPELPYAALLKTLDNQDEFLQLKTAQILTVLLSSEPSSIKPQHLKPFLETLASLTQSSSPHKRDVAVQCLESLLPRAEVRKAVWAHSKIIVGLRDILQNKPGAQMSYQVCFCFWLLTFEQEISENINKKYDIIPLLTDVAQAAVKEKVIRVIVATFRNLVTKAPSQNLPSMLVAQLLPFAKSLCTRKWTDEDIIEDVQFLRDELKANFDSLTTWEEYVAELESGHLSWSPVHESDTFWQENASKLCEKDNAQLKLLVKLLNESTDPLVLAVAAHDLGQFVKYSERGKKIVADLGAKTRIMQLMTHENADLRDEVDFRMMDGPIHNAFTITSYTFTAALPSKVTMPRRPPPTSLRLVKGPLPARGQAKHTLPSVPRPVLDASELARIVTVSIPRMSEPRTRVGHNPKATSTSPYGTMHASSSSEANLSRSSSSNSRSPSRRTVSRDLDSSGLSISYSPPSSYPSASRSSSSLPLVGFGGGVGMGSSSTGNSSPSSSSSYSSSPSRTQSGSPALVRGPWDHSRTVSIDVDSILAMPKPVVVT